MGYGDLVKSWDDLKDHADELTLNKQDLLQAQYHLLGAVMKKEDMPDMKTFVSIYGKMMVNSFFLRTHSRKISHNYFGGSKFVHSNKRYSSPETFGIGLYLLGAVLDHSCVPNCSVKFQGRDLVVTANKKITSDDLSSNIFISYVNTMEDTRTRNMEIKENWFF